MYVKQVNGKYKICGKYTGPAGTGERIYIKCNRPIVGRRVKIEKQSKGALVMCEVFVLGNQGMDIYLFCIWNYKDFINQILHI